MMLYPEGPRDPRAKAPGTTWAHTREEVARMTGFEAKDAGTLAEENMRKMGIDAEWLYFRIWMDMRSELQRKPPGSRK
jgi:hypothetical protein